MGDLLIRNLDDAVLVDLQRRAEANHSSPEEEARRLLEQTTIAFDYDEWLAQIRSLRASITRGDGVSSTDILRNMRYGDERL